MPNPTTPRVLVRPHPEDPNRIVTVWGDIYIRRLQRFMKPSDTGDMLQARINGLKRNVGRVVLETFIGPCPAGMECCHGNGNYHDNRLENLRWGTKQDNSDDRRRHGTLPTGDRNGLRIHPESRAYGKRNGHQTHPERTPRGEGHPMARLTTMQVVEIRRRYAAGGIKQRELGTIYGLSQISVSNIVRRKTWKHVTT